MNLFKPVFCIFNRRRRKQSGEFDIMENVVVDRGCSEKLIPWENWQEDSVESKIEKYRESLMKIRSSTSEMNQEPDFFNEMTPEIKTANSSLKLNFHAQQPSVQKVTFEIQENFHSSLLASPELGEIIDEDEAQIGWESEDLTEVLKQKRKKNNKLHS